MIREQATNGKLELRYCRTSDMITDIIMTKGLRGERFENLRRMTGVTPMVEHLESIEKEC